MNRDAKKVIRAEFVCEPMQALAVVQDNSINYQKIAALACSNQVSVVRLDERIFEIASLSLRSAGPSYTITDVMWNDGDSSGMLAVSATNGMIAVFSLEGASSPTSTHTVKQIWDSGKILDRSAHRICWHWRDRNILASANQDGTIRMFDIRQKGMCVEVFNPRADAARDVQFDPFFEYGFAAVSENGSLSIWDRRRSESVCKISAHTMSGLAVEYHPSKEGVIATGSRDKMCKIWDTKQLLSGKQTCYAVLYCDVISYQSPAAVVELLITAVLSHTACAGYLQLATTACTERGDISIYNLEHPHMAACVLTGHVNACTDFQWLDTPRANSSKEEDSSRRSGLELLSFLNVHQHILSVGKDGRLLLQDLRCGYFPQSQISPGVISITSTGHVVFQRSHVYRGDPVGLTINSETADAPGLFSHAYDDPNFVKFDSLLNNDPVVDEGSLYVGIAEMASLETIRTIRKIRGAEGNVADPAVIKVLAQHYKVGDDCTTAKEACLHNEQIAQRAGLYCRAAVWSAIYTLLPDSQTSHEEGCSDMLSSLPFGNDLIGQLLADLLEIGDCQHFVVVCELLLKAGKWLLDSCLDVGRVPLLRRQEAYFYYLDLLHKLQLFAIANSIMTQTDLSSIGVPGQGVLIHLSCAKCGKEVQEGLSIPWCQKCNRCVGLCSICHKPVKGLIHWCPVCAHGGHIECTKMWFRTNQSCPSGCGHECMMNGIEEHE